MTLVVGSPTDLRSITGNCVMWLVPGHRHRYLGCGRAKLCRVGAHKTPATRAGHFDRIKVNLFPAARLSFSVSRPARDCAAAERAAVDCGQLIAPVTHCVPNWCARRAGPAHQMLSRALPTRTAVNFKQLSRCAWSSFACSLHNCRQMGAECQLRAPSSPWIREGYF